MESYIIEGIERFIFYTNTGEEFEYCEFNTYYFDYSPVNDSFLSGALIEETNHRKTVVLLLQGIPY
ncbi:hypothetical protein [Peribacillus asahii]|uniref:hypothetical protein n=1 Tax=Peribacillus asahii TaxID=228899 RepID=UPI0038059C9B